MVVVWFVIGLLLLGILAIIKYKRRFRHYVEPISHRDWAISHIKSQGNHNPSEAAIDFYVTMLEQDSDDPREQENRIWCRQMYKRQVTGYFRKVGDIPND